MSGQYVRVSGSNWAREVWHIIAAPVDMLTCLNLMLANTRLSEFSKQSNIIINSDLLFLSPNSLKSSNALKLNSKVLCFLCSVES